LSEDDNVTVQSDANTSRGVTRAYGKPGAEMVSSRWHHQDGTIEITS
jgi:hypothetical protein